MQGLMMDVPLSLASLLRRTGQLFGGKSIVSRRADGGVDRRTYADCLTGARRLAAGLARLGVRRGDRVATFCWNHAAHLEAYYGVPASGAVLHTLNIRLHADELVYIIGHADDTVILVDRSLWPAFAPVRDRIGDRRIVVVADDDDIPAGTIHYRDLLTAGEATFDDGGERAAAVMCYTSGTTGRPKGVVYTHRSMVLHSMAAAMPDCMDLREADVVLAVVPMFHANAWGLPFTCALTGSTQVLPGPFLDPARLVELFESERVTVSAGVPTIWQALLRYLDERPGHDLARLRTLLVGGAAIPEAIVRAFDVRHGLRIVHAWGMTETSPLGSVSRVPSELADAPDDEQYAWRATQGRPAPMIEIRARGDEGLVPWDGATLGELEVRGPWVSSAYYDPRRVHSAGPALPDGRRAGLAVQDPPDDRWTDDGWFRTGDIVTIGPTGCVTIQDRAKDLVKSGGEWISTVALESALAGHPAIAEAVVVAVPHPAWGERPLAVVVPKAGATPTIESVREHLAPHFAKWWLPDALVCVEALPRTGTGKYQKNVVRAQYRELFARS